MLGNTNNNVTLIISLNKNGRTPLNVSEIFTSPAILFMIKTFKPTGGVIKPTSTVIKVNIPNQIAVSSGDIPKSKLITKGKKTGIVNNNTNHRDGGVGNNDKSGGKEGKIIVHAQNDLVKLLSSLGTKKVPDLQKLTMGINVI